MSYRHAHVNNNVNDRREIFNDCFQRETNLTSKTTTNVREIYRRNNHVMDFKFNDKRLDTLCKNANDRRVLFL